MMSGSFSHLQVAELPTDPRTEGHEAAVLVLARMALCPDTTEQAELLHEAMLDLIDVPLGWNDLEPTRERLAGFAQVIAHAVIGHQQRPELPRLLCSLPFSVRATSAEVCGAR